MKKTIILILLLVSCLNNKDKKMNTEEIKIYAINYEFAIPSEITINDVVLDVNFQEGVFGPEFINDYIVKKGLQKVKIKLIHPFIESNGMIDPEKLLKMDDKLRIDIVDILNDYKAELVKKLDFPEITQPVPYIEYEWEFEADVPFELEGWKNSEDLSKWDENELEKQVLAKFTQLRSLLQTGDGVGFVKELAFANKEYFIANYFSEAQQQEYTANLIQTYSDHKGIMPLIENYRVRIMGDGKVVTLENLGKHRGQGVLTAEFLEEETLFQNYIMLHKPTNSDHFEIVRVNSQMTSIDD
ncbi:MAG: hypothetical protein JKY08_08075 [Flavobacteriaceae bacterium]|nr:hypothetical protein [Flavobacteriaceae bacterium]